MCGAGRPRDQGISCLLRPGLAGVGRLGLGREVEALEPRDAGCGAELSSRRRCVRDSRLRTGLMW